MKVAIVVHGLSTNYSDPSSLDNLVSPLMSIGYQFVHFRYGSLSPLKAHLNSSISASLSSMLLSTSEMGDEVLLIGFSNGCAIIDLALRNSPNLRHLKVVYIAPILSPNFTLPDCVSSAVVFSNKNDYIVKLLHPAKYISSFLFRRNWGTAATQGYCGSDHRVKTVFLVDKTSNPIKQHTTGLTNTYNKRIVVDVLSSL